MLVEDEKEHEELSNHDGSPNVAERCVKTEKGLKVVMRSADDVLAKGDSSPDKSGPSLHEIPEHVDSNDEKSNSVSSLVDQSPTLSKVQITNRSD